MKNYDYIIPKVDRKLILNELTKDKFVKKTVRAENELYICTYEDSPNILREIGRLREYSFAMSGGGTGKEIDLDDFDFGENAYKQLIVWDPENKEILGGYRYFNCLEYKGDLSKLDLSTKHYFNFSENFIKNYLPYTIELGRSWVQPMYQSGEINRKGIFALDNLWDGLGYLIYTNPNLKYFFGKVTMYSDYDKYCRDLLMYFLDFYFSDKNNLMKAKQAISIISDITDFKNEIQNLNYKDAYKVLFKIVHSHNHRIPPLINSYMNLTDTMIKFETALNTDFGDVEETGILITIADVLDSKIKRHVNI